MEKVDLIFEIYKDNSFFNRKDLIKKLKKLGLESVVAKQLSIKIMNYQIGKYGYVKYAKQYEDRNFDKKNDINSKIRRNIKTKQNIGIKNNIDKIYKKRGL